MRPVNLKNVMRANTKASPADACPEPRLFWANILCGRNNICILSSIGEYGKHQNVGLAMAVMAQ
jgi:hypothetical protein